jgi:hypothetical protein
MGISESFELGDKVRMRNGTEIMTLTGFHGCLAWCQRSDGSYLILYTLGLEHVEAE